MILLLAVPRQADGHATEWALPWAQNSVAVRTARTTRERVAAMFAHEYDKNTSKLLKTRRPSCACMPACVHQIVWSANRQSFEADRLVLYTAGAW